MYVSRYVHEGQKAPGNLWTLAWTCHIIYGTLQECPVMEMVLLGHCMFPKLFLSSEVVISSPSNAAKEFKEKQHCIPVRNSSEEAIKI